MPRPFGNPAIAGYEPTIALLGTVRARITRDPRWAPDKYEYLTGLVDTLIAELRNPDFEGSPPSAIPARGRKK